MHSLLASLRFARLVCFACFAPMVACAQSSTPGYTTEPDAAIVFDAGTDAHDPGTREGSYTGTYLLDMATSSSGNMLLMIGNDGIAKITPKDVNATGAGTIDANGDLDVTTGLDVFAEGTLRFEGTVAIDADAGVWRASGTVHGPNVNDPGTWVATKD